jgi:hypothetical protein
MSSSNVSVYLSIRSSWNALNSSEYHTIMISLVLAYANINQIKFNIFAVFELFL